MARSSSQNLGSTGAPRRPGELPPVRSWRERVSALRNVPPFLKLIWQTSPTFAVLDSLLRLIRAVLPVTTLFVAKLIIDEVVRLAQLPGTPSTFNEWFASGL